MGPQCARRRPRHSSPRRKRGIAQSARARRRRQGRDYQGVPRPLRVPGPALFRREGRLSARRVPPGLFAHSSLRARRRFLMPEDAVPAIPAELDATLDAKKRERATILAILAMLFYQGVAASIISLASPWIGTSFNLDGAGIARLFAWISISSLGALALSRMVDRFGRRRMILWCIAAMPLCSLGAAAATNLIAFTAFQIALYAVVGAAGAGCVVMLSEELPIARRAHGQSFGGLAGAVGAGFCVFLIPIFVAYGWSWRWMFVISAAGVAMLPAMA